MEKIKYPDILDQIPRCRYWDDVIGFTGALTKCYLHNDIFDNHQKC